MSNPLNISHLTGLRISGTDAIVFCQSQLTTDFRQLRPEQWQICAWCDPKGRCLAVILACRDEDHVDLVIPRSQLPLLEKLKLFAIGHKVEFSAPMTVIGDLDPDEASDISRLPDGRGLSLSVQASDEVAADILNWRIADLCLPVPWLNNHCSGQHLPQFLGLEDNGGLSYQKGCFPGQEVIARLHYLGKIKYRLAGFMLKGAGDLAEIDSGRLTIRGHDQGAQILQSVRAGQDLIGLAVCPADLPVPVDIDWPDANRPLSGQMTEPKRLCYYRDNHDN